MNVIEAFHEQIDYDFYRGCNEIFHNAANCIQCCSNPYYESTQIDYSCPQKRKIYVLRYAPAYISEIFDALKYTSKEFIDYILEADELKVASIGGGPGTDIAAFNKWLGIYDYDISNLKKIRYLRVDIHEQWDDVSPELINLYKIENINYEYKKIVRNVSIEPVKSSSFDNFDVIMLSYVISEIDEAYIYNLAEHVSQIMSDSTLVIINDRPQDQVLMKIEKFFEHIGCLNPTRIQPEYRDHCGVTYPDDIYNQAQPTIFKKSMRYNALVKR